MLVLHHQVFETARADSVSTTAVTGMVRVLRSTLSGAVFELRDYLFLILID